MEHRIIHGGDQYLPFARSCVAKLKKLGLPYADQKFGMGDAIVRVRIEPGHEYIEIDGGGDLYMDSGDLQVRFPAPLAPDRLDASKLHFLDIPLNDKYLGEISTQSPKDFGKQTRKQIASRPMVENMDSLAIGWRVPKTFTPPETLETWLAAKKSEMEEKSVTKKLTTANFPASLWTGKMRLFMQAQYGMELESDDFGFYIDIVGTEVIIRYRNDTADDIWQPGLWSHKSPGVYTEEVDGRPTGNYWMIDITQPTAMVFDVYSYKIVQRSKNKGKVKPLRARLKRTDLSAEERTNIEAYLFAHSIIDLSTKTKIGTFDPGEPAGGSLSYGWKFNTKGDKASIILINQIGESYDNTLRFTSTPVHFTFGFTAKTGSTEAKITMSASKDATREWQDGWGTYNIFTPESDSGGPLGLFSCRTSFDGLADMRFSDVPIYGYYKDDVWTPLSLSKLGPLPGEYPKYKQNLSSNTILLPGMNMSTTHLYQYALALAGEGWSYELRTIYNAEYMNVSLGGTTYEGVAEYGDVYRVKLDFIGGMTRSAPFIDFYANAIGGNVYFIPPDSPGYAEANAIAALPGSQGWPTYGIFVSVDRQNYIQATDSFTGWVFHKFAIVIPSYDAEAVYVSTYEIDEPNTGWITHREETGQRTVRIIPSYNGHTVTIQPWSSCTQGGWYGDGNPTVSGESNMAPHAPDVKIWCSTQKIHWVQGVPGGSYYALFNVDKYYPYYDRGMNMFTSYNGRYIGSELPASPPSVSTHPTFIGRV